MSNPKAREKWTQTSKETKLNPNWLDNVVFPLMKNIGEGFGFRRVTAAILLDVVFGDLNL